jgi:hypothetical protein
VVGDLHHVVKLVGDDNNGLSGRGEAAQYAKQAVLLGRSKNRRRLVQNQQRGVA